MGSIIDNLFNTFLELEIERYTFDFYHLARLVSELFSILEGKGGT